MPQNKLRFGVVGVGRIGKIHIENLVSRIPGAEVVAICDVAAAELEAIAARFGIARTFTDYRDLLDLAEIDAVVICSPTDTALPDDCRCRRARQADFLRKADRPFARKSAVSERRSEPLRSPHDGGVQSPLRPQLPEGPRDYRCRAGGPAANPAHHQPRPRRRRPSSTSAPPAASSWTWPSTISTWPAT